MLIRMGNAFYARIKKIRLDVQGGWKTLLNEKNPYRPIIFYKWSSENRYFSTMPPPGWKDTIFDSIRNTLNINKLHF